MNKHLGKGLIIFANLGMLSFSLFFPLLCVTNKFCSGERGITIATLYALFLIFISVYSFKKGVRAIFLCSLCSIALFVVGWSIIQIP